MHVSERSCRMLPETFWHEGGCKMIFLFWVLPQNIPKRRLTWNPKNVALEDVLPFQVYNVWRAAIWIYTSWRVCMSFGSTLYMYIYIYIYHIPYLLLIEAFLLLLSMIDTFEANGTRYVRRAWWKERKSWRLMRDIWNWSRRIATSLQYPSKNH